MLQCNEKHKIILNTRDRGRTKDSSSVRQDCSHYFNISKKRRTNESEKFKRDFDPGKYTFASFKCSPVDQTRRRKAGIGSFLPGILPGRVMRLIC